MGHSHFRLSFYHSLSCDHSLWLSWFLRKILMLQMTYDMFRCILVLYLYLFDFALFIIFVHHVCMSKCSHFLCCNYLTFYLSLIFFSFIYVSIILFISSIFMLTLGHHLAMWYALVSILVFSSFLLHFSNLVLCGFFMSCRVIIWRFI